MNIIFDYNRTLFNPNTNTMYPDVFRVLESLAQRHELILITCNTPGRKNSTGIRDISPYFKTVKYVERKTTSFFQKYVKEEEKTIVIGDRLQDEIRIGVQLNCITIHVQHTSSEEKFVANFTPNYLAKSMAHVAAIIEELENV